MKVFLKNNCPVLYPIASRGVRTVSGCAAALVLDYPKSWIVIKAVILGLPATFLSLATLKLPVKPPGQDSALEWIGGHPKVIFVIIAWPILAQIAFSFLEWLLDFKRAQQVLDRKKHMALYTAIEEVVGRKNRRVAIVADQIRNGKGPRTKAEAFDLIIRPDEQVEHLATALFDVINYLAEHPADPVKVVIVQIADGAPVRFLAHLPSCNIPNSDLLDPTAAKKTLWGKAATAKEPIVIEDIGFHLSSAGPKTKLYVKSDDATQNRGSIAAFPITHPGTGKVIYVLSIKSSQPHLISQELVKQLAPVKSAFTNRLLLEYDQGFIQSRTTAT